MHSSSVPRIRRWILCRVGRLWSQLVPRSSANEIGGVALDAVRSRRELIIENAVVRHQVTFFDAAASARSTSRAASGSRRQVRPGVRPRGAGRWREGDQNGGSGAEYECRGRAFVGSVRREVLDHVLLLDDQHLASLLCQYARYFNESRPHQGLGHRIPADPVTVIDQSKPIAVKSVLGGLHVDYRRAA
jgi:hypothetical protein